MKQQVVRLLIHHSLPGSLPGNYLGSLVLCAHVELAFSAPPLIWGSTPSSHWRALIRHGGLTGLRISQNTDMQRGRTAFYTPPSLPPPQPQCSGQPVWSERERERACATIVRHGSCFPVQFVRAELAAGTSETTPNAYIQDGRQDYAGLSTRPGTPPFKAAGVGAMSLPWGLYGTAGASRSISLRAHWVAALGGHQWNQEKRNLPLSGQLKLHIGLCGLV